MYSCRAGCRSNKSPREAVTSCDKVDTTEEVLTEVVTTEGVTEVVTTEVVTQVVDVETHLYARQCHK